MYDAEREWPLIQSAALKYGVNAYFMVAIRRAENGAAGREFGVLSVKADTYEDQLRIACESVAHRMAMFHGIAAVRVGPIAIMSDMFIDWFAHIWAPLGVGNDPHNLNANWPANVKAYQKEAVANA